ncbi:MAG: hypothetical protein JWQ40_1728 [Segetibacter sp.]|nr:hypothetical protein [Segetibacter sp.]
MNDSTFFAELPILSTQCTRVGSFGKLTVNFQPNDVFQYKRAWQRY